VTELFLDTETFSTTPINCGAHRYAETAEIIVVSWAFDDEPADVCDITLGQGMPKPVIEAIRDPTVQIIGHNFGNFDRTVARIAHGLVIPPERIIDTMVQALSHGLPGSLEKLGEIFGVSEEDAKLKTGKELIQLFCKPRPKNYVLRRATRLTHPDKWIEFLDYAKHDIPSMRHIYRHMPRWNYPGVPGANKPMSEYELWLLDQRVNDRGFKVDLDLARAAIRAIERASIENDARTVELTDAEVERTTQRDKLLKHLLEEYGVSLPDMTKSTLERRLSDPDLPDPVKELIAIRLEQTSSSTAKYPKLLSSVSADGRLRGTIQFCGAARTRRDAGRIFQPQNLPRPTMAHCDIDQGIKALKTDSAHLLFDNTTKLASNALRGAIIAEEGHKLVVADLAQIEARVLPWLAEQEWKLQAFRNYDAGTGPDLYKIGAGRVLGKDPNDITKEERQGQGKVPELACGYGGSVGAFHSMALIYGVVVNDAEAKEIVTGWRKANAEIADWETGLWARLDRAARMAIENPGKIFEAGPYIRFDKWRSWLRMELPSGNVVCFADANIVDDPKWKGKTTIGYMGLNPYTRQWSKRYTYGGKIAADATQSTARDIMMSSVPVLEKLGYGIVLRCHDEILSETADDPRWNAEEMIRVMTTHPSWTDDKLPLAADGFEAYRYRK
jgi:DNA polymerase